MVKAKSRTAPLVGNGGILGSGIFGLFGSTVTCDSETSSLYCNFVKGFNVLIMLLVILGVLYFALTFFGFRIQRGGGGRVSSHLLKLRL